MEIRASYLAFVFLFFADQLTKEAVGLFPSLPRFINPTCNSGIAWNLPVKPALFYPLWFAILGFLISSLAKEKNKWTKTALVLILAGGLSNLFDRARYSCVKDFIDLKIWPVFNLADIYITIGAIIFTAHKVRSAKHGNQNDT